MTGDVRELPGAQWAAGGTRLLAGLYVWLTLWLVAWVLLPTLAFAWSPVVISSGSMGPVINRGDLVLSTSSGLDELAPGQVVTFRRGGAPDGELVTHRIQAVDAEGLLATRGDANTDPDSGRIPPEAVTGRARLLVPYAGLPMIWLRESPLVFVAWLALTSVAVALARAGVPKLDELVDESGNPVFRPADGIWRPLDRVLGLIEPAPRPAAGPVRAWLPTVVSALALAVLVRTGWQAAGAVVLTGLVLLADPRGPHVRIGRATALFGRMRDRLSERMLPRVREQGAAVLLPVMVVGGLVAVHGDVPRSEAAFVDTASGSGNAFASGIWNCGGLPELTLSLVGDAGIVTSLPTVHVDGAGGLPLSLAIGEQALVAFEPLVVPPPCGIQSVILDVAVVSSGQALLRADRLAGPFDPALVTAGSAPAVVRGGSTRTQLQVGTSSVDVTDVVEPGANSLALVLDQQAGTAPVLLGSQELGRGASLRVRFGPTP